MQWKLRREGLDVRRDDLPGIQGAADDFPPQAPRPRCFHVRCIARRALGATTVSSTRLLEGRQPRGPLSPRGAPHHARGAPLGAGAPGRHLPEEGHPRPARWCSGGPLRGGGGGALRARQALGRLREAPRKRRGAHRRAVWRDRLQVLGQGALQARQWLQVPAPRSGRGGGGRAAARGAQDGEGVPRPGRALLPAWGREPVAGGLLHARHQPHVGGGHPPHRLQDRPGGGERWHDVRPGGVPRGVLVQSRRVRPGGQRRRLQGALCDADLPRSHRAPIRGGGARRPLEACALRRI
mmetsp:Transcript_14342/g.40782  ORF Transcript_14342/g.40782 Transcript_14342/m.40782 type:complete len:295 (-) Transcript_14342:165-1049(-)